MLDTSDALAQCEAELGCPVEELLTPLTRRLRHSDRMYAIDNGCFKKFNERGFKSLLEREMAAKSQDKCRFVVAPDIVGNAKLTLGVFRKWQREISRRGFPVALAGQDGLEELDVPWSRIGALFIGGTNKWKLSNAAADCVRAAKIMGKWVHVGRVNTDCRFDKFAALELVDSFDGTGISRYTWMREKIRGGTLFGPMVSSDQVGLVGAASVLDTNRENAEGPRSEVV
jgi:hypothetical protein